MMSPDTIDLLVSLLGQVTLSGSDPDLLAKAARVEKARRELASLANQHEEKAAAAT